MPLPQMSGRDGDRVLIPEGNYPAALIRIYHIGRIESDFLDDSGKKQGPVHKVILAFEVDCRTGEGSEKNHVVTTSELSYSLGEKANLGKLIRGWLEDKFNQSTLQLEDLLGRDCKIYLDLEKSKKGKNYIKVSKLRPAAKEFSPKSDVFWWSITDDLQLLDTKVPDWIKNKAKASVEGSLAGHQQQQTPTSSVVIDETQTNGHIALQSVGRTDDIPF
jgi:hypothetical protein